MPRETGSFLTRPLLYSDKRLHLALLGLDFSLFNSNESFTLTACLRAYTASRQPWHRFVTCVVKMKELVATSDEPLFVAVWPASVHVVICRMLCYFTSCLTSSGMRDHDVQVECFWRHGCSGYSRRMASHIRRYSKVTSQHGCSGYSRRMASHIRRYSKVTSQHAQVSICMSRFVPQCHDIMLAFALKMEC
jgi:hypothetical protein